MSLVRIALLACLASCSITLSADEPAFPRNAKRIVFLGDSITHAGHFISLIEAQLFLAGEDPPPELINLGLPSETCSGLSEPDHPFPRPNVHERIDRALGKLRPDVVVACYGMNDGIYYPPSEERFAAYRNGVNQIIDKVHASGAKLILMTPPAFDPLPLKQESKLLPLGAEKYSWNTIYEDYDDVMKQYATWVKSQSDRVEGVIDLHTAVTLYVNNKRQQDPDFTMSPDGVHVDHEGHQVLADTILSDWGIQTQVKPDQGLMTLISNRQNMMHQAWLSEVGHLRPGVKDGLPIDEAKTRAADMGKQIGPRAIWQRHRSKHSDVHHLHFPASKKQGELKLFVDYFLWIPPGVQKVRGVILHQHGCGPGSAVGGLTAADDLHWRALASKWDCALMSTSYDGRPGSECRLWCDPRSGSEQRFLQALSQFASATGHAEINEVPWCLWGHSGGGFWSSLMQTMHPDKIAAIWLQSGTAFTRWESGEIEKPVFSDAVFSVPVMACPGLKEKDHERFHVAWDGCHQMMRAYRAKHAPFGIAPDPRTGHECGDSRYLAIAFFDDCLAQRLPEPNAKNRTLRPIDRDASWVGDVDDRSAQPASMTKKATTLPWIPSEQFAAKWLQFIATGVVDDKTPPSPPRVTVDHLIDSQMPILRVQLDADLESGVSGFRIERNGK
ncbi:MAG: SGNH/GDSL hydrolase family protein, partial [Pirellulaceae bacterium]|nr:SGNH/GDSL hydrolase family protein [Pirellulaceae bacterium]